MEIDFTAIALGYVLGALRALDGKKTVRRHEIEEIISHAEWMVFIQSTDHITAIAKQRGEV